MEAIMETTETGAMAAMTEDGREAGMKDRLILLLIFTVLPAILLSGCFGGGEEFVEEVILEKTINPDETQTVEFDGGSVTIPFGTIDENDTLRVAVVKKAPKPEGAEILRAYNIDLAKTENLNGYIEIKLRHTGPAKNIVALTYDESSKRWVGVLYRIVDDGVIIYTPHLSYFATAVVTHESGPMAKINLDYVSAAGVSMDEDRALAVLREYVNNNYEPGPNAYRVGWDAAMEYFGIGGAASTFAQHGLDVQTLDKFNTWATHLGVVFAVIQLGWDLYDGNADEGTVNFLKNMMYSAVGEFGTPAMQLSFVGVFAIDYSLTKFMVTAISDREKIWEEAYKLYYKKDDRVKQKKKMKYWYDEFLKLYKESRTPAELKAKIDKAINDYVYDFWEDETTVAFYQEEVMKHAWTGGGGLNEELKKKISENHKAELMNALKPVFWRLEEQILLEMQAKATRQLKKMAEELNKVYTLNVRVNGPKDFVSGLEVYIPVKAGNQEQWSWETDESGECFIRFTLYGLLKSQAKNKVVLITKTGEKIEQEFKLTSRSTSVVFNIEGKGSIQVSVTPKRVAPGDKIKVSVQVNPPVETELEIKIENIETGYGKKSEPWKVKTGKDGRYESNFVIQPKDVYKKAGKNVLIVTAPELGAEGKATFEIIKPEISVTVSPSTVRPGEAVVIKARVEPPGRYKAKLSVLNAQSGASYSDIKYTDSSGNFRYQLRIYAKNIEQKLGTNIVSVEIPKLGVMGTASFVVEAEVMPTPKPTQTPAPTSEPTGTPLPGEPTTTPQAESPFNLNKEYKAGFVVDVELQDGKRDWFNLNTYGYGSKVTNNIYHVKYDYRGDPRTIGEFKATFDQNYRLMTINAWQKILNKKGDVELEKGLICNNLGLDVYGRSWNGDRVRYWSGDEKLLSSSCTAYHRHLGTEMKIKRVVELDIKFRMIEDEK